MIGFATARISSSDFLDSSMIVSFASNGLRLSGDGRAADGVRCSRGLGDFRFSSSLAESALLDLRLVKAQFLPFGAALHPHFGDIQGHTELLSARCALGLLPVSGDGSVRTQRRHFEVGERIAIQRSVIQIPNRGGLVACAPTVGPHLGIVVT